MKSRRVRRLYQEISGEERFRLAVQADVRGDSRERDHLVRSCPRVSASVRERAFARELEGTEALVELLECACAPYLGWLELLDLLDDPLDQVARALVDGPPRDSSRALLVMAEAAEDRAASVIKTVLNAFGEACRTGPGLEPEVPLSVFAPHLAHLLGARRDALGRAVIDPELMEAARARFEAAWRGED